MRLRERVVIVVNLLDERSEIHLLDFVLVIYVLYSSYRVRDPPYCLCVRYKETNISANHQRGAKAAGTVLLRQYLQTTNIWRYSNGLTAQIGYFGQTAVLNDCLYKNMYKSKFVLLNDIDEIILPTIDWDWSSMMENLQKQFPNITVFHFENHIFPTSVKSSGFDLWSHVSGVNILHHNFREPINWKVFNDRKMVVNPREVFQTSIHTALKHRGKRKNIGQDVAITFHCTHKRRNNITTKDLILDDSLRRYNLTLVPNVDRVIRRLFPFMYV
ncbi:uncharacterized protein [Pyxicephalus adspersus]|uniref:uncharacterized protein n=1 Tax=Pyxicephalus adspersus TaxID=30357 RepID=UPI003B5C7AE2